jgi:endonuclease/exonuclease/phosphatase family metal-dependent hydrolase
LKRHSAFQLILAVLSVFAFEKSYAQYIPIAEARSKTSGSVLTVRGRVTVANAFGGPAFVQDNSAGIAVYAPAFHIAVQPGDSVEVTGTVGEFENGGVTGRGLLQLAGNVTFSVFPTPRRIPDPAVVGMDGLSEAREGILVRIPKVDVGAFELFRANTNYWFGDGKTGSRIRIYSNTGIGSTPAPDGPVDLTGILSEFRGQRQLLPRSPADFQKQPRRYDAFPKEESLLVMSWNVEWFGDPLNGPSDDASQVQKAAEVIKNINPDIAALQEIASSERFSELLGRLPGYSGFLAPFNASQKTAYLYKRQNVDSLAASLLSFPGNEETSGPFAGRLPFEFYVQTRHAGRKPIIIRLVNIHAKAFSDAASYQRRKTASGLLKPLLDQKAALEPVILAGDFNDDLDVSTFSGQPSPYQNFVSDSTNWLSPTLRWSKSNISSYSGGSTDPIDHIVFSKSEEFYTSPPDVWIQQVAAISSFSSTASDHYPIVARIPLPAAVGVQQVTPVPTELQIDAFPNPFNPSTQIRLQAIRTGVHTITLFDVTGRLVEIRTIQVTQPGNVAFSLSLMGRASGMYFLQVRDGKSASAIQKLTLVK